MHQSHLDAFVYIDHPLPIAHKKQPSAEETKIGNLIAENLVDNGATLQMGKAVCFIYCEVVHLEISRMSLLYICSTENEKKTALYEILYNVI